MSLIWRITLDEEAGGLLFTKLSPTEIECNECKRKILTKNRGPANVKAHLATHPHYQLKFEQMEKAEESKKGAMKRGLAKFVIHGKGIFP